MTTQEHYLRAPHFIEARPHFLKLMREGAAAARQGAGADLDGKTDNERRSYLTGYKHVDNR